MSSEKQSPPFHLSGLSYSFFVFLPLFKEKTTESSENSSENNSQAVNENSEEQKSEN